MWPDEAAELGPDLREAEDLGVEVFLLVFDENPTSLVRVAPSPTGSSHRRPCSSEWDAVSSSRSRTDVQALIGGAVDDDAWAVYCEDPAVILVCAEYITHDISYQHLCERIGADHTSPASRSLTCWGPSFLTAWAIV